MSADSGERVKIKLEETDTALAEAVEEAHALAYKLQEAHDLVEAAMEVHGGRKRRRGMNILVGVLNDGPLHGCWYELERVTEARIRNLGVWVGDVPADKMQEWNKRVYEGVKRDGTIVLEEAIRGPYDRVFVYYLGEREKKESKDDVFEQSQTTHVSETDVDENIL